jgi:tRNA-specific 2-thiouridylase
MSGGVDSSVVAAELAAEGYDVVGVTLQLYDHGAALAKSKACCAGRDIHDARRVAERMGFPHYVLDYESVFRDAVMDDFADTYLGGATPVPCIRCNERIKFRDLLETARDLDADCMATGHYIRRFDGALGPELHVAADPARDQSYFLFSTTPGQLAFLRFPLGGLASKAETRALAVRHGLPVADDKADRPPRPARAGITSSLHSILHPIQLSMVLIYPAGMEKAWKESGGIMEVSAGGRQVRRDCVGTEATV